MMSTVQSICDSALKIIWIFADRYYHQPVMPVRHDCCCVFRAFFDEIEK